MNGTEDSINRKRCLETLLSDEEFSDMKLIGSDGGRVDANRKFLAAKSPVFRRMLCGGFSEAFEKEVRVDYSTDVLRMIKEYVYTESVDLLNRGMSKDHVKFVPTMVELINAANYYELGTLCKKAISFACRGISRDPCLCAEYFCLCETPVTKAGIIENHALPMIQANPDYLQKAKHLRSMSSSSMESVLKDKMMDAPAITMFNILNAWCTGPTGQDNVMDNQSESESISLLQGRKNEAVQLTKNLKLDCIHPAELSNTVASSGLVTQEQINKTIQAQALFAFTNNSSLTGPSQYAGVIKLEWLEGLEYFLNNKYLPSLSSPNMEMLLKDKMMMNASPTTLFRILHAWGTRATGEDQSSREKEAARLTQFFKLELIHPEELSKSVLVSQEQIQKVTYAQAILAGEKHRFTRSQYPGVWKTSNDGLFCCTTEGAPTVETLNCPRLRINIHKWSIVVEELCSSETFLGVVRPGFAASNDLFWWYSNTGRTYKYKYGYFLQASLPTFGKDSVVAFTLDLTPERGGRLSASVNGNAPFELFTNMLRDASFPSMLSPSCVGFLPAVSLYSPGKVRFLGFD